MSSATINKLLDRLGQTPQSISISQVENWVKHGRKRPKNHLIIWLSRIKNWRIN